MSRVDFTADEMRLLLEALEALYSARSAYEDFDGGEQLTALKARLLIALEGEA